MQLTNPINPFGMDVFTSPYLPTEEETYTVTLVKTLRERWLKPLQHPVTVPFEPWVKTHKLTKVRMVPSKNALVFGNSLFVSPAMMQEMKLHFQQPDFTRQYLGDFKC